MPQDVGNQQGSKEALSRGLACGRSDLHLFGGKTAPGFPADAGEDRQRLLRRHNLKDLQIQAQGEG